MVRLQKYLAEAGVASRRAGEQMILAGRVAVNGRTLFACVDGPEFDGHLVDFDLLTDRLSTYRDFEQRALAACEEGACKIGLK